MNYGNHYEIESPERREQMQGWLRDAEQALHELRTGTAVRRFVDQNGEQIEYTAANAERLRGYIIELRTALGLPTGITGPMRFRL